MLALLRLRLGAFGLLFVELLLPVLFFLAAVTPKERLVFRFFAAVVAVLGVDLIVSFETICGNSILIDSVSHSISLGGPSDSELDESTSSYLITFSRSVSLSR